jgi:hypothetical protein
MYEVTFEVNGKKVVKSAKTKSEVRRLVYIYSVGNQAQLENTIEDLTKEKKEPETIVEGSIDTEKIIKQNKTKKNVSL